MATIKEAEIEVTAKEEIECKGALERLVENERNLLRQIEDLRLEMTYIEKEGFKGLCAIRAARNNGMSAKSLYGSVVQYCDLTTKCV